MLAVFLDTKTLGSGVSLEPLKTPDLSWHFFEETPHKETASRIQQADIVVSNKVKLTAELLRACKNLKLICVAATGYNNVDIEAAQELGIKVCNVPDYSTASVVQLTIAFIFSLFTNLCAYVKAVQQGAWEKSSLFCLLDYPILEIRGKRLGIVGYGNLGKEVARAAQALGMDIVIASHKNTPGTVPLNELLKTVDVVTIHTPLTPQTKNLIGAKELALMKKTAFLINTARGGIVNEKDLAQALKHHVIAGAAMDVLTTEPPTNSNPLLERDVPNLILTPHVGWASLEARTRLVGIIKENIHSFLKGTLQNAIQN